MEEVWKDISLASLQDNNSSIKALSVNPNLQTQHFMVQDFLVRPFRKDPPKNGVPPLPPPPTFLSLNSGPGVDFIEKSGLASFDKKSVQEPHGVSGDRRHKRMIKNRESAARSRARKQAYTNELEIEVAYLMEENARLKTQQEQVLLPHPFLKGARFSER